MVKKFNAAMQLNNVCLSVELFVIQQRLGVLSYDIIIMTLPLQRCN